MISRYRKLHCFIIKRKNYREKDKIITVFTKEKGKLTLLAKGIRNIKSKRAGSLELFNQVFMQAAKTGGMDVITEVELLKTFPQFSKDYQKTQIAFQIIELIDKLTYEKQEHVELYQLLDTAMTYVNNLNINVETHRNASLPIKKSQILTKEKSDEIIIRFKKRILNLLGFGAPDTNDLNILTTYIESIIEKTLNSYRHLKI
jgi:Recombination protein O N terminal